MRRGGWGPCLHFVSNAGSWQERVPGSASIPWVRLRIAISRAPTSYPRPQSDVFTRLYTKCSSGFTLIFLKYCVSLCKSKDFIRPPGDWPDPQGLKFQDPFPFLSKVPLDLLCLQAGMESRQCPDRSEASQLSYFWSLNKTSSILISLTKYFLFTFRRNKLETKNKKILFVLYFLYRVYSKEKHILPSDV